MRKFALIYFVIAAPVSYFLLKFQVFPGTIVIDWVADRNGTYLILLAFVVLLLLFLIPLLLIFLIYNLVGGKKEVENGILDMAGISFNRDKQLFGALFPMEILVDGKKKASVTLGKTVNVSMPPGERTIEVRCMQRSAIQRIHVQDHQSKSYRIGLRKMAVGQDVYLEEMTEDFQ